MSEEIFLFLGVVVDKKAASLDENPVNAVFCCGHLSRRSWGFVLGNKLTSG